MLNLMGQGMSSMCDQVDLIIPLTHVLMFWWKKLQLLTQLGIKEIDILRTASSSNVSYFYNGGKGHSTFLAWWDVDLGYPVTPLFAFTSEKCVF